MGSVQMLCGLHKRLEHPWSLVSAGVLGPVPCGYGWTAVVIYQWGDCLEEPREAPLWWLLPAQAVAPA